MGLSGRLVGPSVVSVCISCLSVSGCLSPVSGACVVVGDWTSVRGDLSGGAESGLVDEHLLGV